MKEIDINSVVGWNRTDNLYHPGSIDLVCPHCGRQTNMRAAGARADRQNKFVVSTARCSACSGVVKVWAVECLTEGEGTIAIHPHSESQLEVIPGSNHVTERVRKAYAEAIATYNGQHWASVLVNCRRTLEGIVSDQVPAEKHTGNLNQDLRDLPKHIDLQKPLLDLTHSIRKSGNLGAHFDPDRDPDRAIAKAAIEFIEFFMEYIYVLPGQVSDLQDKINQIETEMVPVGNNAVPSR